LRKIFSNEYEWDTGENHYRCWGNGWWATDNDVTGGGSDNDNCGFVVFIGQLSFWISEDQKIKKV